MRPGPGDRDLELAADLEPQVGAGERALDLGLGRAGRDTEAT